MTTEQAKAKHTPVCDPRLTIEQAIAILDRSERGRAVGRQLHEFLADRAGALDMEGKVAVLSLLEESFVNRPGSVFEALGRFADQNGAA